MYSIIVLKIYIYLFRSEEKKERKKELSSFVPDLGRAQFYFYTGRITKKKLSQRHKTFLKHFQSRSFFHFFFLFSPREHCSSSGGGGGGGGAAELKPSSIRIKQSARENNA